MKADVFLKQGAFLMLALDHDSSFRKMMNPDNPGKVSSESIIALKGRIMSPLFSRASGILIDSEHGLPAFKQLTQDALKHRPPFLLRAEASGYEGEETARLNKIVYSPADLKKNGAKGVKLLLNFNPFSSTATQQLDTARSLLEDSHKEDLPIFIEIVTYNVPGFTTSRGALILSSVERFVKEKIIPDVWKLEFPEDKPNICREMTHLVKDTPWILLSRGVSFGVFREQLETAAYEGARGFLAGRALWKEVSDYHGKEQDDFLREAIPARFEELSDIVLKHTTPTS